LFAIRYLEVKTTGVVITACGFFSVIVLHMFSVVFPCDKAL
jgi:hypothetical protein